MVERYLQILMNQINTFDQEIPQFLKVNSRLVDLIKSLDFNNLWNGIEIELDHIDIVEYYNVSNMLTESSQIVSEKTFIESSQKSITEISELDIETDSQEKTYDVYLKIYHNRNLLQSYYLNKNLIEFRLLFTGLNHLFSYLDPLEIDLNDIDDTDKCNKKLTELIIRIIKNKLYWTSLQFQTFINFGSSNLINQVDMSRDYLNLLRKINDISKEVPKNDSNKKSS